MLTHAHSVSLPHALAPALSSSHSLSHALAHSLSHSRMHRRTRTLVHTRTITALMLNPEEDLLYSGATDRLIKVRSGASLQAIPCWFAHASGSGWSLLSSAPCRPVPSEARRAFAVSTVSACARSQVWEVSDDEGALCRLTLNAHYGEIHALVRTSACSTVGDLVITAVLYHSFPCAPRCK